MVWIPPQDINFSPFPEDGEELKKTLMRRREIRGTGVCAMCENSVFGRDLTLDNDDGICELGDFEGGDILCFWCFEDYVFGDPNDFTPGGHA
jgi:hypothetical protein